MNRIKECASFLASRTLTLWLMGIFVLYYLSAAIWSKEAFGTFIINLSKNNFFRTIYLLFFLNACLRSFSALKALWRNKTLFFLRLPLLAGIIVFLLSLFMSLNVRESRWLLVGEGDVIELPWERTQFRVVHIESAVEKKALRQENSAIFDYEPLVTLEDKNGIRHTIGAFPPSRVSSTYMHILNFGIGPGVELRKKNELVWKAEVALRLIPFGNTDIFEMKPLSYKFYVRIVPNRIIKKGKETARNYDLSKPRYQVEVVKGDNLLVKAVTEDRMAFDGNMSLRFSTPANWVLLDVAHDPFLVWFVAGLALLFSGVLLYPFSRLGR